MKSTRCWKRTPRSLSKTTFKKEASDGGLRPRTARIKFLRFTDHPVPASQPRPSDSLDGRSVPCGRVSACGGGSSRDHDFGRSVRGGGGGGRGGTGARDG